MSAAQTEARRSLAERDAELSLLVAEAIADVLEAPLSARTIAIDEAAEKIGQYFLGMTKQQRRALRERLGEVRLFNRARAWLSERRQ